ASLMLKLEPHEDFRPSVRARGASVLNTGEATCISETGKDVGRDSELSLEPGQAVGENGCRLAPVCLEVKGLRPTEGLIRSDGSSNSRDAIAADFLIDRSYEVPDAALGHQPKRINQSFNGVATTATFIINGEFLLLPYRLLDDGKEGYGLIRPVPSCYIKIY